MNLLAKMIVEFKTSISCDLLDIRPALEYGRQFSRTFSNPTPAIVRHTTVAPSTALSLAKDGDGMWLGFPAEVTQQCMIERAIHSPDYETQLAREFDPQSLTPNSGF